MSHNLDFATMFLRIDLLFSLIYNPAQFFIAKYMLHFVNTINLNSLSGEILMRSSAWNEIARNDLMDVVIADREHKLTLYLTLLNIITSSNWKYILKLKKYIYAKIWFVKFIRLHVEISEIYSILLYTYFI